MEKNGLVSVVIPIYNSEKFLVQCIESVLNQTYKNIEIIAVNDGSTDNSLKILEGYSDKISIISQKNQGLASALNRGIDYMNGRWFKWFSPDDVMYPQTIETLVDVSKNLDNNIVYSNWIIIDESGKVLRTFSESNYNRLNSFDFNVILLDGQQINVNTTLIPFTIFEKGLKMNQLIDPVLVDYEFFLRAGLLHKFQFHLIEKPLIKFRIHQSQLSHQNIVSSLKNLDKVKENVFSNIPEEKQIQYNESLKNYKKRKSFSRKSMESGLKIISNLLPSNVTDKILIFYLNKIRSSR